MKHYWHLGLLAGASLILAVVLTAPVRPAGEKERPPLKEDPESLDWQLPNEKLRLPYEQRVPIVFVNMGKVAEWSKLPKFWNEMTEEAINPQTGEKFTRKVVKIKVPLGLTESPAIPEANEMTVERWILGKKLYFDPVLSSDGTIACASCHDPKRGWTDQSPVSTGIGGAKGGVSAPTIINTAYNRLQFWDGRAFSLEDQAQGPVANPIEMFSNKGHAWDDAVKRVRRSREYVEGFRRAYGSEPTRDTIAKAIATFERTVLSGNSIHDRAEMSMRIRVAEEGGTEFKLQPVDYENVLRDAAMKNDTHALKALGVADARKADFKALAKSLHNGRELFFDKARCSQCHVGFNFTDNSFHNLGVGMKDGLIPKDGLGRFAAQPIGDKNPEMVGAFKTPTLRGLLGTAPYMHNGSEKTLEEVVEFYDKGGNPNRYLSTKMRDFEAEKAYLLSRKNGTKYEGPKPFLFGPDETVIIPKKLNLTAQEKKDLVLFLRALEGDPIDPIVADPDRLPPILSSARRESAP